MYLGFYSLPGNAQTINYKMAVAGGRQQSNASMALDSVETYTQIDWVPSMSAETVSELPVPPKDYTKSTTVTVNELPAPNFTLNGPSTTMEGQTEHYTVTVTDSADPMTIIWNVNGVSYSGGEVDINFPTPGHYDLSVTVNPTGHPTASRTSGKVIIVSQYPTPTITMDGPHSTVEGKTERYSVTVTDSMDPMTITWNVNGTTYQGSPVDVSFPIAGSYTVEVSVHPTGYPNSAKTGSIFVVAAAYPKPTITMDGPRTTIEGKTERYTVTTNSTDPMTITWDVSGVSYTGKEADVTFPTAGNYDVKVIVFPTGFPGSSRTLFI